MSDWYSRLTDYFPEKEMKSKKHFEILFHEKRGIYQVEESPSHVIVYLEKDEYIFIDYILVTQNKRGNGKGSKILEELKHKGKAIILEVEPVTQIDPDSKKRVRFYEKNGFRKMESISYERIHMVTDELNKMDILCWSPIHRTEQWVYDQMKTVFNEVHAFKAKELYNRQPQLVTDVLRLRELTLANESFNN
ncbi:GNAT family N-acetyltransferase [Robertmurraya sp. GLU-23]